MKKNALSLSIGLLLVGAGVFAAAFGIAGFLIPNGFLDGGVTGISMLLSRLTGKGIFWYLLPVNLPFVFLGWKRFGFRFVLQCLLAIVALSLVLWLVPFPCWTKDKILGAVFGGILLGAGIGFAVQGGAVLDGTEIAAILISRRIGISIGGVILLFNLLLFSVAGFVFGPETAMYSILTYLVASKSANFIIHGIEEYVSITIISAESEPIKRALLDELEIGMTVYNGRTGYSNKEQEILLCVTTRYDVPRIRRLVATIDEKAFLVVHPIENAWGGLVRMKILRKRD